MKNLSKCIRTFGLGFFVTIFAIQTCLAYQRLVDANGHGIYWDDNDIPVTYWIDSYWFTDEEISSLNSSFQTWQAVETSYLTFSCAGLVNYDVIGHDGYNICTWHSFEYLGLPPIAIGIALTLVDNTNGRIVESDIIFNLDQQIFIGSDPYYYDLQSVATHEIGHVVGLADLYSESDVGKVMYGMLEAGEIRRTLSEDDKNGVSAIYPVPVDTGGGGPCFIATATYGTSSADDVRTLCLFRDKYLLTNQIGRSAVSVYYKLSPAVADVIGKNKFLKFMVRIQLKPLIWVSRFICIWTSDNNQQVE